MSYILDALEKSEQQRNTSQTPGLNTQHRLPGPATSKKYHWLIALTSLLILNGLGLGYWFQQDISSKQQLEANGSQDQSLEFPIDHAKVPELDDISFNKKNEQQSVEAKAKSPLDSPKKIESHRTVKIADLPENIQAQIPELIFTSHLYSDEQSFRMVNINGKMIKQGENLTASIQLIEITEEGVILNYLDYTFEISVLRDWHYD